MKNDAFIPPSDDVWFLPLGGASEIGMNLNLFGHDGEWLMVDCGITFHDRLGIEIITPDPTFIAQRHKRLSGIVLTHAHEDHIGALPYLWSFLRCPIYATPFTAEIVRQKMNQTPWKNDVEIIIKDLSSSFKVGKFDIEFITLTHSIPEPNAVSIKTPIGTIMHTGDWKIDPSPLIGEKTNSKRLKEIGEQGVHTMICDSTSVFVDGASGSEELVRDELTRLIKKHKHERVFVACFASNVARMETAMLAAKASGRRAVLAGRSLERMFNAAQECGYLKDVDDWIPPKMANKFPDHELLILCTGSQGEGRAALPRMANSTHPDIKLKPNDIIYFSSRIIPGNEKAINALHNTIVRTGAKVVTANDEAIHVSGHPARDELRQMYRWIKPHMAIPVHGEARHLIEQAELAKEEGVGSVVVPENGSLISLRDEKILNVIPTERWVQDGNRMIPMASPAIQERKRLSFDGCIVAVVHLQKKHIDHIDWTLVGLCHNDEEERELADSLMESLEDMTIDNTSESMRDKLAQIIRTNTSKYLKKKPYVDVHFA